ncbi:hypothetical protein EV424DRAFT_1348586 [Suillus variegatus]|nr:hypothetical protein EV424DRAFT_1348586 [Suillus variegatus]
MSRPATVSVPGANPLLWTALCSVHWLILSRSVRCLSAKSRTASHAGLMSVIVHLTSGSLPCLFQEKSRRNRKTFERFDGPPPGSLARSAVAAVVARKAVTFTLFAAFLDLHGWFAALSVDTVLKACYLRLSNVYQHTIVLLSILILVLSPVMDWILTFEKAKTRS